jgi:enamine deaminase RidA (YjgF/YER057c/UK114 family)
MNVSELKQQLNKLGLVLPVAPTPVGSYRATIVSGGLVYISGQLPILNGVLQYKGKVGHELSIDEGYKASELCALNVLSQINNLGSNYSIKKLIRVDGYINCSQNFIEHAQVLDGASNLFSSVFGSSSGHVRSVSGCSSLPLDSAVELVTIAEINNQIIQ